MTSLTGRFERPSLRCTGLVHTVAGSANEKLAQKFGIGGAEVWNRVAQKFGIGCLVHTVAGSANGKLAQKFGIGAQKFGIGGAEVWNRVRRSLE